MVPTFNVLAVVDLDCRFIFVCSERPGCLHDYTVLQQVLVQYRTQFPHPPHGNMISPPISLAPCCLRLSTVID